MTDTEIKPVTVPGVTVQYGLVPRDVLQPYHRQPDPNRQGWYLDGYSGADALEFPEESLPYFLYEPSADMITTTERVEDWKYQESRALMALRKVAQPEASRFASTSVVITGWDVTARGSHGDPTAYAPKMVVRRCGLFISFSGPAMSYVEIAGLDESTMNGILDQYGTPQYRVIDDEGDQRLAVPLGRGVVSLPGHLMGPGGRSTRHIALDHVVMMRDEVVDTEITLAELVGDLSPEAEALSDYMCGIAERVNRHRTAWFESAEWSLWHALKAWRRKSEFDHFELFWAGHDLTPHMEQLDRLQRAAGGWIWWLDVDKAGRRFVPNERWERLVHVRAGMTEQQVPLLGRPVAEPGNKNLDARVY
jgi:hypothetical protein